MIRARRLTWLGHLVRLNSETPAIKPWRASKDSEKATRKTKNDMDIYNMTRLQKSWYQDRPLQRRTSIMQTIGTDAKQECMEQTVKYIVQS